ncbi:MAG TPA: methyltransferase domain-containing protein [Polyangiaceae bacterium]|nr:methyltransferase domain-containing protein [Polyangiaceae bacterium]
MRSVEERAQESLGRSMAPIYGMVTRAIDERGLHPEVLLDVGCGRADFYPFARERARRYVGVDVLRYPGFPEDLELVQVDLETGHVPLADGTADVVVCAETIEHVENPRALARELVRLVRADGWVFITTPNQLSGASLLCLLARGQFLSFQEFPGLYPAHLSALLEIDLIRIARECGLVDVAISYTGSGRIPFTPRHWPAPLQAKHGSIGRVFSDNILVCGRKPAPEPRGASAA